jgi:demethoxyubiquinone hydroxylase (CLK1/Coq7/Cat5 family)
MKKTNPKKIEKFIRVDHVGERGAIKIYEGQLFLKLYAKTLIYKKQ